MGKLFGTDGIRGIVSSELDALLAFKIGASSARVMKKENNSKLTFLVGSDTRISKDVLKHALVSGVLSENADIIDLGVIPTPAISYLIQKYNASGGFVISASHNPSEYNGIKVFNDKGFKLDDNLELEIEDIILNNFEINKEVNKVGSYTFDDNAVENYVNYLIGTIDTKLDNLNIVVDVANGAAYKTAESLFSKLNCKYKLINSNPDGYNINDNAGSTHIKGLIECVKNGKYDCGIAFDGDADRCLLVSDEGKEIDGDYILAIYADYLKKTNSFKNNTIVGTVMSNLGLVKFCENNNINFEATKVGDRYVLENMLKNDYIIGGEQSGHIIFKQFANTGDGQLTALQILNILNKENKKLSEISKIMDKYPQVLKNVEVSKEGKETYQQNSKINKFIDECTKRLNGEGRVLVRASGTENLIRVMLEGKDIELITTICDEIVNLLKEELN